MRRLAFLSAVVAVALVGGAADGMAADPVATIFMSPEAGVLVTLPAGTDGTVTLPDDTAAIAAVDIDAVQSLVGNSIIDQGGNRSVDFTGSGNFLTGVLSVNQEAGNMNNQANVRSIAIAMASGGLGEVQINVNASQELRNNTLRVLNAGNTSVTIDNSFNNGSGIVGINQTAGNLNQQLSIVAIGIGLNVGPDAIQVGDTQLGQIGTDADNQRTDDGTLDSGHNTLSNSFNDFSGIAQISQVTGDMNRVSQAVAVSVTTMAPP